VSIFDIIQQSEERKSFYFNNLFTPGIISGLHSSAAISKLILTVERLALISVGDACAKCMERVLEKLTVAHLIHKCPAFLEPKGSLPCS
jgi:hypothetical protein